jgi:proteasome accessory factor B
MRAADALRKGVLERVPLAARAQLARLDRKFFAVSFVPKDYAEHSDTLDEIVQALIYEFRLTIDYAGVLGEGKEHDLEPYTLLSYRGGLYLVGRSLLYERVIWLAVERIRGVKYTPGDGPRGRARFTYPREFHPERYTDGMFGVVDGPETEVELAIANTQTEAYLSKRTVHPSQRFERSDDGRLRLVMTVRGTVELANWIMGLTPWVEVVRPSELREEIAARCRDAVRGYER